MDTPTQHQQHPLPSREPHGCVRGGQTGGRRGYKVRPFFFLSLSLPLSELLSFRNRISGSRGASHLFYLFIYLSLLLLFSLRHCGINIVEVRGRGEQEEKYKKIHSLTVINKGRASSHSVEGFK